jgi:Skp family chaperone for outer membrane proteins
VKTSLVSAALVAVLLGGVSLATYAFGQAGAPVQTNGQNLAVIDIGAVFEKHARFKQQMETLKGEIEQADKQFKADAEAMNQMISQLHDMKPDSADYHRLDADLTKRKADFEVSKNLKNKEVMERQSKIYLRTYEEVEDAVKQISKAYNIALVIRYDSKDIDASDPQGILRGIQRPIVFVDKRYDMTQAVIDSLNRSGGVQPGNNGQAGLGVPDRR